MLPKNLKETVQYIDDLKLDDINFYLSSETESDFVSKTHFGLGLYLRNDLCLWCEVCEIRDWFYNNYFIYHPDDISSLILAYYYNIKNEKDTNLTKRINDIHNHWKKYDDDFYKKFKKFKLDKINENYRKQ